MIENVDSYFIEFFDLRDADFTTPRIEIGMPGSSDRLVLEAAKLSPGVEYQFNIYSVDSNGKKSSPMIKKFETRLRPPSDIHIIEISHDQIEIGWQSGPEGCEYRILVENIPTSEVSQYKTKNETILLQNLSPSTAYKLTIMIESETGVLGQPTYYLVTTAADPPSDFKVIQVSSHGARFGWIPPISRIKQYEILIISTISGEKAIRATLPPSQTFYEANHLVDGRKYKAYLTSKPHLQVSTNNSPPNIVQAEFTTPIAPPIIQKKFIDSGNFVFTWKPSRQDNVLFSVRYLSNQLSGHGEFSDWFHASAGQYTYTLSSLLPATKYFLEAKFISTEDIKGFEFELILS